MTPDTVVPPDSLMLKDGSRSRNCLLWTIRPFFQKHPSPALGWKKLFGRWIYGMQNATKHCLGSWGVDYILPCQRQMTLFSHGGPLSLRWKVLSLYLIIAASRIWMRPDWCWGKTCGHPSSSSLLKSSSLPCSILEMVPSPEKCMYGECPPVPLLHYWGLTKQAWLHKH